MLDSLFARFSRNANALPTHDSLTESAPSHRFDIVEYGRVLFSTDDEREALRSLSVFVGASVIDNSVTS